MEPIKILKEGKSILNKITETNFQILTNKFIRLLTDNPSFMCALFEILLKKAIDEEKYCIIYARMIYVMTLPINLMCESVPTLAKESFRIIFKNGLKYIDEIKTMEQKMEMEYNRKKKGEMVAEIEFRKDIARRRSLGSVQFIGELYNLTLLSPLVMISSLHILISRKEEHSYECLAKLLKIVGRKLDKWLRNPAGYPGLYPFPNYFENIFFLLKEYVNDSDVVCSSRVRCVIMDVIELREHCWIPREDIQSFKEAICNKPRPNFLQIPINHNMPFNPDLPKIVVTAPTPDSPPPPPGFTKPPWKNTSKSPLLDMIPLPACCPRCGLGSPSSPTK